MSLLIKVTVICSMPHFTKPLKTISEPPNPGQVWKEIFWDNHELFITDSAYDVCSCVITFVTGLASQLFSIALWEINIIPLVNKKYHKKAKAHKFQYVKRRIRTVYSV